MVTATLAALTSTAVPPVAMMVPIHDRAGEIKEALRDDDAGLGNDRSSVADIAGEGRDRDSLAADEDAGTARRNQPGIGDAAAVLARQCIQRAS
jgi:hypothetical protein